ncbi:DUF4410 domain-containing protein [Motiliproteus coralliicola]|uniref:DUF4410 domain-containing protein n=1 Tax=Motiliproteus coralliicola TaxID=2283196 RepID=A0A369WUC8_9GAMM|nr:DUF4410 domain-containing protein [Motiliproteus coralliicola]RDE25272.1 DUF4410 domain-containing protein [Motiliproteus coralliicola]
MIKKILLIALSVSFMYGCSSGVKRAQYDQAGTSAAVEVEKVSNVSVSLTAEAKEKVAENLKFDQHKLLSHVKRALDSRAMLLSQPDGVMPSLELQVKDFRVRSNLSAVMLGFMAGSDSITGDVVLKNPNGQELDRFEVSVSYALGGIGGGQDDARMGWLYEKFAEETLKELRGQSVQ